MASFRLTDTVTFPPGTTIKAYQARGGEHPFPGKVPPDRGQVPPSTASVVTEGVMGGEGVTLSGLEYATEYLIAGLVAGVWRWVGARTAEAPTATGGASGITEGEADARYLRLLEAQESQTVSGPVTLAAVTAVQMHALTLAASAAITLPATTVGSAIVVRLKQDGSGSHVPSFVAPTGSIRWFPEGIVPTWSSAPGAVDAVTFEVVEAGFWDAFPSLEGR